MKKIIIVLLVLFSFIRISYAVDNKLITDKISDFQKRLETNLATKQQLDANIEQLRGAIICMQLLLEEDSKPKIEEKVEETEK